MAVQRVQDWTEDTALEYTNVESDGGRDEIAQFDMLRSVCEEIHDPQAEGCSKL